ncbi:hypothetical protein AAG570_009267 [Ranatra chinensis]|uniref:Uncharacterized protein n=1 Tax=Ranatra chinensis TaxID=642074 RepID=A0ABD0ZEH0_9HEMI
MSGKTSLIVSFTKDEFFEDLKATALEVQNVELEVDGRRVNLEMWDTSGQADYDRLRPTAYPDADVCVICFSVGRPDSLENVLSKWAPEVNHFCPGAALLLVGNKDDLRGAGPCVPPAHAHLVAKKIKAVGYLECSAKTKHGVRHVFEAATRAALKADSWSCFCTIS